MINYEQTIQKIINSIKEFSFEFDIEDIKKEMKLQEVSNDELNKLGEKQVNKNFNTGVFKIKIPNGNVIDIHSIKKQSLEKKIEEPVIFINSNFKYVKWVLKKDFTSQQIKRHIKKQLTSNSYVSLVELKKALLIEEIKLKKIEGYVGDIPVKISDNITQGKFYLQASCSNENAIKMVNNVIEEIEKEKANYVKDKINEDYKKIIGYFIFIIIISFVWLAIKLLKTLPNTIFLTVNFFFFFISLVVMRLINHNFFDAILLRQKTKKKYEKEFFDQEV